MNLPHLQQLAVVYSSVSLLHLSHFCCLCEISTSDIYSCWDPKNITASSVIRFSRMRFNIWQLAWHITSSEPCSKLKLPITANESGPHGENSSTNLLLSLISDLLRHTALHLVQYEETIRSADTGSNAVIKKAQKERGQNSAGCMLEQQNDTGVCWKEHVTIFMAGFAVQK